MALLDLSRVTKTLVKLIEESVKASPVWPAAQTLFVTGLPPDKLTGDNAVGVYLYHLAEEGTLRSQVWPGRPLAPPRFSPMALNLYYVLSAHSDVEGTGASYREQLLMGLAVKALHDYPTIDAATKIGGVSILDPGLAEGDNTLRISLRLVPPNEAVSYWTAGSQPLRLSA